MTALLISAELAGQWAESALAAKDAVDLIDLAIWEVMNASRPDLEALDSLLHARSFAGVPLNVFALCMNNEARIALKVAKQA